jgi:hypothetical protein
VEREHDAGAEGNSGKENDDTGATELKNPD